MNHWSESDFEQWLYGLKEPDSHAEECQECRGQMTRLQLERRRIVAQPEISNDFLAAQRRGIYRRMAEPHRNWLPMRWAMSAAMVLVVVFGLTLPRWYKSTPAISDEQLFSELASMDQSAEPRAIQPMHRLFEEQ
jgi:predicted anti-sigma-YlaC factor YlaD